MTLPTITLQSVGFLCTSDQLVVDTSTRQHSQQTDIHVHGRIRTHNPSTRVAADPRLRSRGHWDHSEPWNTLTPSPDITALIASIMSLFCHHAASHSYRYGYVR